MEQFPLLLERGEGRVRSRFGSWGGVRAGGSCKGRPERKQDVPTYLSCRFVTCCALALALALAPRAYLLQFRISPSHVPQLHLILPITSARSHSLSRGLV